MRQRTIAGPQEQYVSVLGKLATARRPIYTLGATLAGINVAFTSAVTAKHLALPP